MWATPWPVDKYHNIRGPSLILYYEWYCHSARIWKPFVSEQSVNLRRGHAWRTQCEFGNIFTNSKSAIINLWQWLSEPTERRIHRSLGAIALKLYALRNASLCTKCPPVSSFLSSSKPLPRTCLKTVQNSNRTMFDPSAFLRSVLFLTLSTPLPYWTLCILYR